MENHIYWDCHMHSAFSADSSAPMEDMAKKAAEHGLKGICFTEHLDPDYPPIPDAADFSVLDIEAYRNRILELKNEFKDKLDIRFGIELGLQPQLDTFFNDLLQKYPFDFVIGSSHVVHGYDPYYPDFFRGRRESTCYMEYFESILENLAVFSEMDVYGHLDYIVRYGPGRDQEYSYGRYRDILDEILLTLIEKHVGIELNTGGLAGGLREPNPCIGIVRRYRQLGGEIITVGSDAHEPGRIGFSFGRAADILLYCGFTHYAIFKDRQPEFVPLC